MAREGPAVGRRVRIERIGASDLWAGWRGKSFGWGEGEGEGEGVGVGVGVGSRLTGPGGIPASENLRARR